MFSRLPIHLVAVMVISVGTVNNAYAQLVKATPEQIDKDIKALIAGGNGRSFALKRLDKYEAPLEEKQAEVAGLLMKLVKDDKSYDAMRALSVWATETELKEIKDYLSGGAITKAAVFVYSKKKYPPVAKELALFLEGSSADRKDVVAALILIGSEAEDLVIPYLMNKDKNAVRGAIEFLSRAGTTKGLDALNKGVNAQNDKSVLGAAKSAVLKIEEREKEKKDKIVTVVSRETWPESEAHQMQASFGNPTPFSSLFHL